jgi:hypothetical protein
MARPALWTANPRRKDHVTLEWARSFSLVQSSLGRERDPKPCGFVERPAAGDLQVGGIAQPAVRKLGRREAASTHVGILQRLLRSVTGHGKAKVNVVRI